MTREDRKLLLKDLCARLPYNVKVNFQDMENPYGLETPAVLTPSILREFWCKAEDIRPYLRPMSSMTDEEKEEMHNLLSPEGTAIYGNDGIALPLNHCGEFVPYEFMNRIIQYLLKNHFDFMGLISKNLAIEVTKENNPYENRL